MGTFKNSEDALKFIETEVLTVAETTDLLGISRPRLFKLTQEKRLNSITKSNSIKLFYRADVEKLKEELEEKRRKYRPFDSL